MIPAHAQQTLDDIAVIRQRLDDAESAIRAVYGGIDVAQPASPGPVAAPAPKVVHPKTSDARPAPARVDEQPAKPQGVKQAQMGGKYDAGILRALRSEAAQFGMSLSDVTRTFTGPGKPAEVERLVGTIHSAMQSLQRRGLIRKDGRMWHVVREAATA